MDQKFTLVFETTTGMVEWVVENHVVYSQVRAKLFRWDKFIDIAWTMYNTDHIISVKIEKWPLSVNNR